MHDADWYNCSEIGLSSACRPHCSAALQNAAEREVRSEICGQWGWPHIRLWSGGDTGWWGVSSPHNIHMSCLNSSYLQFLWNKTRDTIQYWAINQFSKATRNCRPFANPQLLARAPILLWAIKEEAICCFSSFITHTLTLLIFVRPDITPPT